MRCWSLTEFIGVIISQPTIILYTLNLHNDICQLYFNKTGKQNL